MEMLRTKILETYFAEAESDPKEQLVVLEVRLDSSDMFDCVVQFGPFTRWYAEKFATELRDHISDTWLDDGELPEEAEEEL